MERGRRGLGVRGIAGCACGGGLPALLEAVALPVQFQDVNAVGEAVQQVARMVDALGGALAGHLAVLSEEGRQHQLLQGGAPAAP